ncbi:MAG: uracil-DNA glycosylase [Armatimonadetes bacterium]|nr:uracil-DNA glycosylase [Armatimonadota bacterium]
MSREQFQQLVAEAQACRLCPRMEGRRRVLSAANGPLTARVLFVAEAPGRLGGERSGVPLTGDASGRNFCRYLAAAGLRREDVFVTNAALCNPRTARGTNAPPSASEVRNCSQWLRRTLEIVRPEVVTTLGSKALAALALIAPHAATLREHAATPVAWNGYTLFPLYHPSPQVAVSPTGRSHTQQEEDYRALRRVLGTTT